MLRLLRILPTLFLSWALHAQSFTWTRISAPTTENLWGICYGSNQFVAVGDRGTILTSPDGSTWTSRPSGTSAWLTAICYANGLYVAVGDSGTILTSPDALTWTIRAATGPRLNGIAHGNGRFVAVGESGTVRSSIDTIDWTTRTLPIDTWLRGIVYESDSFLIGGGDGTLCSTEDGTTFRYAGSLDQSVESLVFTSGITIAVGNNSSVSVSSDRQSWTAKTSANAGTFRGVTRTGTSVLAVGDAGSVLYTDFAPVNSDAPVIYKVDAPNLNAVASGPRKVVIVGNSGTIFVNPPSEIQVPIISAWGISPYGPFAGGSVTLSAQVAGSPPLTFQWSHAGVPITDGTTDVLTLNSFDEAQTGNYTLTVTNSAGSMSRDISIPKVEPAPSPIVDGGFRAQGTVGFQKNPSAAGIALPGGQLLILINRDRLMRLNADGTWDISFHSPANMYGVTVGPDGSIFVNTADSSLKKLLHNGAIDPTFAASVEDGIPIEVAGGKIVGVSFDQGKTAILTRLNSDGSRDLSYATTRVELEAPDTTFGASFDSIVSARDADGGIFIAAVSHQSVGTGVFGINESKLFRLRNDGTLDPSFIPHTLDDAISRLTSVDHKLYYQAGQQTGSLGYLFNHKFVRLDAEGRIDAAYAPVELTTSYSNPHPILLGDGSILAVGPDGLVRYSPEGNRDDTFNGRLAYDALGKISHLFPFSEGKVLVVGSFPSINGVPGSGMARVSVPTRDPATHLVNLSIRTTAGNGDQTLIAGFVIAGSGSSRSILMRGVGPGLVPLGLNSGSVIADPQLKLFKGSSVIAINDDWEPSLEGTASSLGAYPLARDSKDAAILSTLEPGPYTVHVNNAVKASGIALVELFDADAAPTSAAAARLVNVSGRARVGTGDNVLIAGFVLAGQGTKRLLVRAVGPGLGRQGVTDYLSDPELIIYHGSDVVASNDNWPANDASISATFTAVGAFALDAGSKDAAVALELAPGVYTAVVRGVGGTTGSALVEVYEVP